MDADDTDNLPLVAVFYAHGAAGSIDIARACREVCTPVWVVAEDADKSTRGLLEATAAVVTADELLRGPLAHSVRGIVCFSEIVLDRAAVIAEHLNLPFTSSRAIRAVQDKYAQRAQLHRAGIDNTISIALTADGTTPDLGRFSFPGILKPRRGYGSQATFRVTSELEMADILCAFPGREFVLESELVGKPADDFAPGVGDYVSVELMSSRGETEVVAVTGKWPQDERFRESGGFMPAWGNAATLNQARDLAVQAVQALEITEGMSHTEVKLTEEGPKIIEVNARLGGEIAQLTKRSRGLDVVKASIKNALRLEVLPLRAEKCRVAFEYTPTVPAGAVKVLSIEGMKEIRALPQVDRVDMRVRPGDMLGPDSEMTYAVGIFGACDTHKDLFNTIAMIRSLLSIKYEYAEML